MRLFDLTQTELDTLLRVGQPIGINTKLDLLLLAEKRNISSGSQLINFVYAATIMPWLLEVV